jgi:activator of HSP90 ATPase
MILNPVPRRDFFLGFASVLSGLGIAGTAFAGRPSEEISHSSEAIHQEVDFKASPQRVYQALLDSKEFATFSGDSAEIHGEPGGAFSLFGGRITGRIVELVSNERMVQAWRSGGWGKGIYSIARFDFKAQDSRTRLIFDHTGFPNGAVEDLLAGWKEHYWGPLQKYFS